MTTPLNQRVNDVFLSHSSRDKDTFVDKLFSWLSDNAALKVWYDRNLVSAQIASKLEEAIDSSRSAIIVLSENSVASHWVELECNRLQEEAARNSGDFRIATVRLDHSEPSALFKSSKHIDIADNKLTASSAALLMDSLFGGRDAAAGRSVYVSRGWRPPEKAVADRICQALKYSGLSLFCDCVDQPHWQAERVRGLIDGAGGLIAIMPHRGNGQTSSYILREIAISTELGLPTLLIAHQDVRIGLDSFGEALRFDDSFEKKPPDQIIDEFGNRIEEFIQSWKPGHGGQHVFLGHSLEASVADGYRSARGMLSRITGLPVEVGGLVLGASPQKEIIRLIANAAFCVIDITNRDYDNLPAKIDFALNSCVEAGIALGAGKNLYVTCRAPRRTPPFMIRDEQVCYYESELELVGYLRQFASRHRRFIL